MQRNQLEAIVASLDTGTLIKMLQVAGVHVQPPHDASTMDALSMQDEKITPWNDVKVGVGETSRPPIHNRDFMVVAPTPRPTQRQIPGMGPNPVEEPYMQQAQQNYIIGR